MGFFSDLKAINKVVLKKSANTYVKGFALVPMLAIYILVYNVAITIIAMTIGQLGAGGNFIAGISEWFIRCFIISDFMYFVDQLLMNRKINIRDIGKNYMMFFSPLLSATAIPSIILSLFMLLTRIPVSALIIYIFYIIYAIPEIVYQKRIDRLEIFVYGHNYLKENWKQWLIPNVVLTFIFVASYYLISRYIVFNLVVMFGSYNAIFGLLLTFVTWIILAVPSVFCIIYRGYIFKILSVSSRRKREYMRNIYGN